MRLYPELSRKNIVKRFFIKSNEEYEFAPNKFLEFYYAQKLEKALNKKYKGYLKNATIRKEVDSVLSADESEIDFVYREKVKQLEKLQD
jgi:hypothetical protein